MLKTMIVTLTSSEGSKELKYSILPNVGAQMWADSVRKAIPFGLREDNRFSNFNIDPEKDLEKTLFKLDACTQKLKQLHPDLKFDPIDRSKISESIHHLHYNFAHSYLVTKLINDHNKSTWEEFNVLLHAVESCLHSKGAVQRHGLPDARVVFTFNENFPVSIPDEVYKEFTLELHHGYVYMNYNQVGRQLFEMYLTGDTQLADEHIQPARFISADTFMWFGYTLKPERVEELYKKVEGWFKSHESRFNSLGLHWGDAKLSLGMLPVAKLENSSQNQEEIKLIQELSHYHTVSKVEIV